MSKESTPNSESGEAVHVILKKRHKNFMLRLLEILPEKHFASLETSRMTLLFFSISGLDVLGCLCDISTERRKEIIEWIYSLQMQEGFIGSSLLKNNPKSPHLAMTYTALATLVILGDDLSRVNKAGILSGLGESQRPDGSFRASMEEYSNDMRFVYCAVSTCTILNDFSSIDVKATANFILDSLSHEGAFGQGPGLEAHGGSTYCAVASLRMLGQLGSLSKSVIDKCVKWCSMRLKKGFNGRPNKDDDTCYTFWIGATLKLLSDGDLVNAQIMKCTDFVLSTQDPILGGLAKWPDLPSDPLHTYLGLAGLALVPHHELNQVDPELNISLRSRQFLQALHKS